VVKDCKPIAFPKHHIELLRSSRQIFEPLGMLNPGEILADA